jgi:hypothetical protein
VAAAYATGGMSAQAMSTALANAAQSGGCNGVSKAFAGENNPLCWLHPRTV